MTSPRTPLADSDVKRPLFAALTAAGAIALVFTCTTSGPPVVDEPVVEQPTAAPEPPPFTSPPTLRRGTQRLPAYGRSDPDFPWLPGESTHQSRSIGSVTDGFLVNARPIPKPHPHLDILPRQFERGLHYTGGPMYDLLVDAAEHVAEAHPESRVHLGNLSAPGGGNIPHSVSHNNGRDADVMFFTVDEHGEPTRPPDLLSMNDEGWFDGSEREETKFPELVLKFDVERNWRLIEGMIESDAADIQYIFVSNPLRRKLLREATRRGASAQTLAIAREVLVQPGGSTPPHDDHFHVRIHCTATDFAAGCRERGRPGPTFQPDRSGVRETVARAVDALENPDPEVRRSAIRRLAVMPRHSAYGAITERLADDDPTVRASAARALSDHRPAADALADRLAEENSPHAFAELLSAVAAVHPDPVDHLVASLDRDVHVDMGSAGVLSAKALAANALARTEHRRAVAPLIDALSDASAPERLQIVHALRLLTNHHFTGDVSARDDTAVDELVDAWQSWWDEHRDLDRNEWLVAGFESAGFDVGALEMKSVWELCRAISADRHLSYNAQRVLANLAGDAPNTVEWHPHDASFYWRRWFEDRQDEFVLPTIPPELSTADGYTPPP